MSLWKGAIAQLRVVHALALRETRTRFGKNQAGYLWALVEPCLFILMIYGVHELAGRQVPSGMAVIPFLATGFLTYFCFRKTADQTGSAVSGNKALLFYPQVQTLDLVYARALLETVTYTVVFLLILGVHAAFTGGTTIDSMLRTVLGLGLAGLLGMCLGLIFCALSVVTPTIDRIRGPFMRPLFWTSGLFFTANELPTRAREFLLYNPVLHTVETVRDGWFPEYTSHYANPTYVMAWVLGFAFFGLTMERAVRRKVELS